MKLKGMTETDVDGIIFAEFPNDRTWTENRDYLELLISEVYDDDCQGLEEDERPEIVLSPFMVMRALMRMAREEFCRMPISEKTKLMQEFWDGRKTKCAKD